MEETILTEESESALELHGSIIYFFADDSLIFIDAKIQSCTRLNEILRIYSECSGQSVHIGKSAIYFSTNTPQPVRFVLKQCLDILVEAFAERYLGLPMAVGE